MSFVPQCRGQHYPDLIRVMSTTPGQGGIRFDPTINLGHLLTFVGFVISIAVAWTALDKRIMLLEESRKSQAQVEQLKADSTRQTMTQLWESLAEIKITVNKLADQQYGRTNHAPNR